MQAVQVCSRRFIDPPPALLCKQERHEEAAVAAADVWPYVIVGRKVMPDASMKGASNEEPKDRENLRSSKRNKKKKKKNC